MATSSLVLHRGAREVSIEEVRSVETPAPTSTHYPIPFDRVLGMTIDNLRSAGFEPTRQRLALHGDNRFFAVIDLQSVLVQGVTLAAALRSSHDRSLPYGFVVGGRVFCCDNLSLSSDLSKMIRVKHTRFGEGRFDSSMGRLVRTLPQFVENEAARIQKAQFTNLTDTEAESLILRAHEKGVVSYRNLMPVLKEFRTPSYPEFEEGGKTLWRLENAFTTCLGSLVNSNPGRYSRVSIALQSLLYGKAAELIIAA